MAIAFPTALDSLSNPAGTDTMDGTTTGSLPHHQQHADANDAVEALEAKVGIDGSAVTTSLDYRISQLESTRAKVVASADLTGQTAAVASVASFTTPAADGTYRVGAYLTITAVVLDVIQVQCTYTDETNAAVTQTLFTLGATSANLSSVGAFVFPTIDIRVKASTTITVKTVLTTGTGSITYDVGATVEKLR